MPNGMRSFTHYVNTRQDDKIIQLKKKLGYEGYGIFWAVLETLYASPNRAIELNYDGLAALLSCSKMTLQSVLEDFGLFEIDKEQGTIYSRAAKRYADSKERKQNSISEKRRQAAFKSWETRRAASNKASSAPKCADSLAGKILSPDITKPSECASAASNATFPEVDTEYRPPNIQEDGFSADDIVELWNQFFAGTKQEYRGFLSSAWYKRARETLDAGYSFDDLKNAFRIAKSDDFAWTLPVALKRDNIQILLAKGEKQNGIFNFANQIASNDEAGAFGVDWSKFERRE